MLKERDKILCSRLSSRKPSQYLNSFFISQLLTTQDDGSHKYDYNSVKRHTKKFDVSKCDKIFVPINTNNSHWTLAVIFVKSTTIKYYDSLRNHNTAPITSSVIEKGKARSKLYLNTLKQWICDEVKEKSLSYDVKSLKLECDEDYPQQIECDCGIFTIMCADFLSDDLELSFTAKDMPYFRRKILKDIQAGSLDYYMFPADIGVDTESLAKVKCRSHNF